MIASGHGVEQALSLCFERQLCRRADALICRRFVLSGSFVGVLTHLFADAALGPILSWAGGDPISQLHPWDCLYVTPSCW
jgi:hypothetical protein